METSPSGPCLALAVSLTCFVGLIVPLAAQSTDGGRGADQPTARAATEADLAEAESLRDQALFMEWTADRSGWLMAASLHIRSAQHRPLGDEQVFRSLFRAAQLLHVLGRDEGAQRTLEQSAAHARLYGHIAAEARALLDAAWLANERHDAGAMNRLLSRAYLLTYSPLLPEDLRTEIQRRILLPDHTGTVAIAAAGAGPVV